MLNAPSMKLKISAAGGRFHSSNENSRPKLAIANVGDVGQRINSSLEPLIIDYFLGLERKANPRVFIGNAHDVLAGGKR